MAKAKNSDVARIDYMNRFKTFFEGEGETVLQVKSGTYCIPWAIEGEEGYLNVTFSIPKGSRDGEPFDGFEEAENYKMETEAKAQAKAEREEKKRKKIEKDKVMREKAKVKKENKE